MRKEFIVPIILVISIIPSLLFFRKSFPIRQHTLQNTPNSAKIIADKTEVSLLGTLWQWDQTKHADGTSTIPTDASKFRMKLNENHMTSTTDCNTLNAEFIIDHEVLSFGPTVSTKMYCKGSVENAYTQSFPLVTSYTIENGILTLILIKDSGTMHFSAVE